MQLVRRVDDMGRVVIPKEIRRELSINIGDPLLITSDATIGTIEVTKYAKYKDLNPVKDFLNDFLEVNRFLLTEETKSEVMDIYKSIGKINENLGGNRDENY